MSQTIETNPTTGPTKTHDEQPVAAKQPWPNRSPGATASGRQPSSGRRRVALKALAVAAVATLLIAGARLWGWSEKV